MVKDPHGEDAVEAGEVRGNLFDSYRDDMVLRVAQVALHHLELQNRGKEGLDAEDEVGAGAAHAPAVITVAAADIEDAAPRQRLDVRQQPFPLPVGAPLGINPDAEEMVRAFAPRVKGLEQGDQLCAVNLAKIGAAADADLVLQGDSGRA